MMVSTFMVVFLCSAGAYAHGTNWSKVIISTSGQRAVLELHVNDQNIARLPAIIERAQPVPEIMVNDMAFILAEIWKGILVKVDGAEPDSMNDEGYRITGSADSSVSAEFHSHGRTVISRRSWRISDSANSVSLQVLLFSGGDLPLKWLVLTGVAPHRVYKIIRPGESVEFNFREMKFTAEEDAPARFFPLWIASGISLLLVAGSVTVYLLIKRKGGVRN